MWLVSSTAVALRALPQHCQPAPACPSTVTQTSLSLCLGGLELTLFAQRLVQGKNKANM